MEGAWWTGQCGVTPRCFERHENRVGKHHCSKKRGGENAPVTAKPKHDAFPGQSGLTAPGSKARACRLGSVQAAAPSSPAATGELLQTPVGGRNPQRPAQEGSRVFFMAFPRRYLNRSGECVTNLLPASKNNNVPAARGPFQPLCQIPGTSVENTVSIQRALAATCKCSLVLKKRLRRLIAPRCLFPQRPGDSQRGGERRRESTGRAANACARL